MRERTNVKSKVRGSSGALSLRWKPAIGIERFSSYLLPEVFVYEDSICDV